ncbi:MAG: sugar transferase [Anaerolineaceae bacterium]|nr:sugar transferase [Anaerolineaceae bacterium]
MPDTYQKAIPDQNSLFEVLERIIRRTMDILVSFFGLLLLSPLFLYIAIRIKKDSPGPVFFRGARAGRNGKPFGILKFRTMYEDENSYRGSKITAEGDERITALGKFLRDSKINELPQLWNVLVGEMSLVGPRPEDPTIASQWPREVRELILSIRPGITSPASVTYRDEEHVLNGADPMQQYFQSVLPSKLRLDQLYVRNRNLLTDIDVIFYTAVTFLPRLRNRPVTETRLFWGPFATFTSRYLNWFAIDTVLAFSATLLSELIWRTSLPLNLGSGRALLVAFLFGILFSLFNALLGLNRVTWSRAAAGDALQLAFSVAITTGLLAFLKFYMLASQILPVGVIITTGVLSFIGFVFVRYRERLITGAASRWISARGHARTIAERVLIIGAGDNGEMALWMLNRPNLARTFSVVGILDDDPRKQGARVNGVEVIGTTQMLREAVQQRDVGLIVYTIHNVHPARRMRLIREAHSTGIRTVVLPDLIAQLSEHDSPSEHILKEHPLDHPLTLEETNHILQHLSHLAHQGDLTGVQSLADQLINLLPTEDEDYQV